MKPLRVLSGAPHLIRMQFRAVLLAWTHFTYVPLPASLRRLADPHIVRPHQAARYMPLISAIVGLTSGLMYLGFQYITGSKGIGVTAAIVTTVWVTQAFRERGAGHFFDRFSKGKLNRYARGIGATGTIAIMLLMFSKYQFLINMPHELIVAALVAAHAFSSFVTMAFLFTHKPLIPEMHGRYTNLSEVRLSELDFVMLALIGMLPIALLGHPAYIALLPALWIIRALLGAYLTRRPEQYTSDALAISQQVTELGFYLGILIMLRFVPGM